MVHGVLLSRVASVALAGALALIVAGCQQDRTTATSRTYASGSTAPPTGASSSDAGSLRLPVFFEVGSSRTGPTERRLEVEVDGSWTCDNCAGDDTMTSGKLSAAAIRRLQTLLNPGLEAEDKAQRGKETPDCPGELVSNMISAFGVVVWSDCPGNQPPPITAAILDVLTQETPLVAGIPAS
jgi:hypothetical protein